MIEGLLLVHWFRIILDWVQMRVQPFDFMQMKGRVGIFYWSDTNIFFKKPYT